MKNLIISFCVCLALAVLPCSSRADDHPGVEKAGGVLSSTFVGAGAGLLVGAVIAAASQASSGSAMTVGLVAGACLGALFAILNPAPAGEGQAAGAQGGDTPAPVAPAATAAQGQ